MTQLPLHKILTIYQLLKITLNYNINGTGLKYRPQIYTVLFGSDKIPAAVQFVKYPSMTYSNATFLLLLSFIALMQ